MSVLELRDKVQQILDQYEVGYVEISQVNSKMVTLTCGDMDYRVMAGMVECEQKVPFVTAFSIDEFLSGMNSVMESVRLISQLLNELLLAEKGA
jgi:hypothetical protein